MSRGTVFSHNHNKSMKRNIIEPNVAVKLSLKAYMSAKKEFNQKQEELFNKDKTNHFPATVKAMQLKETHHQVFYTIINYYRDKVQDLNRFFNGSSSIMTHVNPKRSMHVTTGRIAAHLERSNATIRKRLSRLEEAGIIKVVFHGHKKPLEIIFNKNVCIIFDKCNLENISKSKFLKEEQSGIYSINNEKVQNKESTISRTYNNNTITKTSETTEADRYKNTSNLIADYKILKKAGTTETDLYSFSKKQIFNPGVEEKVLHKKVKERKKVPAKKERKEKTIKEIREARFQELKEKVRIKQMTETEKTQYYKEKNETNRLSKIKEIRREALKHYSLEFYAYLISELFPDKHLTSYYRIDTLNYISKYYFAKAKSVKEMEFLLTNYKKRVDISKKWIEKYKNKSDKGTFDTTYFYPLAYLNIEKTGKKYLSFVNTEKFIKQKNEWGKINGYNRNTDKILIHKMNKIVKEFKNGFIDYKTALEKVELLSNKTDEYIKQFNASYFGMYKTMPSN